MFLRMLPDQIMRYWDEVKVSMSEAMPPHVDLNFARIQELFLVGDMDCWVSITNDIVRSMVTTQILTDMATDTVQMVIYSVTALEDSYAESWREMHETLVKYARSKKCSRIVAYTNNEKLIALAQHFGADASWRLLWINV